MIKKEILFFVIIGMLVGGLLASCAPTPTEETFTIKYTSYIGRESELEDLHSWMLDEIEERSEGRIKTERTFGAALGSPTEYPAMLVAGTVDMAVCGVAYTPSLFPLNTGLELAYQYLRCDSYRWASEELYRTYEPYRNEWEDNGMKRLIAVTPSWNGFAFREPVYNWEGFQDLTIRTYPGNAALMAQWAANPLTISFSEAYEALQRGLVEATDSVWFNTLASSRFFEVAPYITDVGTGPLFCGGLAMSLKTWNKLPADLQAIIEDVSNEAFVYKWEVSSPAWSQKAGDAAVEAGAYFVYWSDAEIERAKEQALPEAWQPKIDEWKDLGLDVIGNEMIDKFMELQEEYMKAPLVDYLHPFELMPTDRIIHGD